MFFFFYFRKIGFYGVFSTSAVLYLISFLYGVFILKEPKKKLVENSKIKKNENDNIKKNVILDFFDKKHVIETFKVAFKNGPNQRRLRVITLMIVVMVVIGPLHGLFILK